MKKVLAKIVLLGDAGVGKTSIMNYLVNHRFSPLYKATIGADFLTKEMQIGDTLVTLQIWDTAGQERFQSLGVAFYRGANCGVVVCDATSLRTFDSIPRWRDDFLQQMHGDIPIFYVASKADLSPSGYASHAHWLPANPKYEVSSKVGSGVQELFEAIALKCLQNQPDIEVPPRKLLLEEDKVVQPARRKLKGGCVLL